MKVAEATRGLILDVDGTLVDSNNQHARSWYDTFLEFGYQINFDVIRQLIGMGGDKLIARLIGQRNDSKIGKKVSKRRDEIFETRYLSEIKPFPKTRELIQWLKQEDIQLAVATSAPKHQLSKLLEVAEVADLLPQRVSAEEAGDSKPDPDVIKLALQGLKIPPENVRMLGDTPYDIEAAALVEVRTIALRCGGWESNLLTGALAIFADPADLLKGAHLLFS